MASRMLLREDRLGSREEDSEWREAKAFTVGAGQDGQLVGAVAELGGSTGYCREQC